MEIIRLISEVGLFILLSAVCSGLNVALMSLDVADLKRKSKIGSKDAARVLPLRINSHLSLAAILLSNVAAISATSLVLENFTGGLIAGVATTLLLVVFGEIFPQALFSRHALKFTARLSPILRAMIIVTFPVSKPVQLLLDKLFGKEKLKLHSRDELGLLITEHLGEGSSELDEDEIEIMRGALQLSDKRIRDIMTPIRSVYWATPNDTIDIRKISEIKSKGWSRIPILNKQLTICYGVLHIKDLVNLDFRGGVSVQDLPLYPTEVVGSMTALDTLFRKFIVGGGHLIPIEKDDRIVGIVTIEDLLEEIVGHEIEDEADRRKHKKLSARSK